jgi:hypothetical protein
MQKLLALPLFLLSMPLFGQQTPAPSPNQNISVETAPFSLVQEQVASALKEYQSNLGTGQDALPPLSSAVFDFKTTTAIKDGFTFNILVFTLGSKHEKDITNDVTFTYSLPKPEPSRSVMDTKSVDQGPPQLKDQLALTIQSAAKSVKDAHTLANLPFSKLTINLQFGVTSSVNAGGQVTYSIVTVGLTGEKDKNTIQSVTLTFGQ